MNASLARVLRDVYSSCVRSFEQPNYYLGYFANWNNGLNLPESYGGPSFPGLVGPLAPVESVRALILGAGNTVSTAYVISRPALQDLVFYSPSMKKSVGIGLDEGEFLIYERPWFVNFFFPNQKSTPGWFTYYKDAVVVNQNDSTICYPASTAGTFDNSTTPPQGCWVCWSLGLPRLPNSPYAYLRRLLDCSA